MATSQRKKAAPKVASPAMKASTLCRACRQSISGTARKCHKCGNYQRWWYAVSSGSGIAIAIASASLVVSLYPLSRDALHSGATDLDASPQAANLRALSILVQNNGGRSASFFEAQLTVKEAGRTGITILVPKDAAPSGATIIPANSSILLELTPVWQEGWVFAGSDAHCAFEFVFIDHRGADLVKRRDADCNLLMPYILNVGARYRGVLAKQGKPSASDPFPMLKIDDDAIGIDKDELDNLQKSSPRPKSDANDPR